MSGLLPEQLTEEYCGLLEEKYGSDWFHHLGYDDTYKKPLPKEKNNNKLNN